LELALEEPFELCVARLLLAVRHAERVRLAIHETNIGRVSLRCAVDHEHRRRDVRSCAAVHKDLTRRDHLVRFEYL
jgi:hypothetical protein